MELLSRLPVFRQYGLVLKKKPDTPIVRPVASIFADDDDDSEKVVFDALLKQDILY